MWCGECIPTAQSGTIFFVLVPTGCALLWSQCCSGCCSCCSTSSSVDLNMQCVCFVCVCVCVFVGHCLATKGNVDNDRKEIIYSYVPVGLVSVQSTSGDHGYR